MGYSGYLDNESIDILSRYKLVRESVEDLPTPLELFESIIAEQDAPSAMSIVPGLAPTVPTTTMQSSLDKIFQSNGWWWFKIFDPTGISSWPDFVNQAKTSLPIMASDSQYVTLWEKFVAGLFLVLAFICAIPGYGLTTRGAIKGALKTALKGGPKALVKDISTILQTSFKDKGFLNAALLKADEALKELPGSSAAITFFKKIKDALNKGSFDINDFIDLPPGQKAALDKFLDQFNIVEEAGAYRLIPKSGTEAAKEKVEQITSGTLGDQVKKAFEATASGVKKAGGVVAKAGTAATVVGSRAGYGTFKPEQFKYGLGPGTPLPSGTKTSSMKEADDWVRAMRQKYPKQPQQ